MVLLIFVLMVWRVNCGCRWKFNCGIFILLCAMYVVEILFFSKFVSIFGCFCDWLSGLRLFNVFIRILFCFEFFMIINFVCILFVKIIGIGVVWLLGVNSWLCCNNIWIWLFMVFCNFSSNCTKFLGFCGREWMIVWCSSGMLRCVFWNCWGMRNCNCCIFELVIWYFSKIVFLIVCLVMFMLFIVMVCIRGFFVEIWIVLW